MTGLDQLPTSDPTSILRYRDGIYAVDLLGAAIVHFRFFEWIAAHPATFEEICRHFGWAERPADVLITLALANQWIERGEDGRIQASPIARDHLASASPWKLTGYFESLKDRPVVADFVKVLKTGKPAHWSGNDEARADWHDAMLQKEFAISFTRAMDCRGVFLGKKLADALAPELAGMKRLLDIGGGSGVYSCSLAANHPELRAAVLEQPPVDDLAREMIAQRQLSHRVSVTTADMFASPWPEGCDAHLFSNVMHDWDKPEIGQLLAKSRSTFGGNAGYVFVHEVFLNEDKSGPLPAAEYSAILAHSTRGRCYSWREMADLMEENEIRFIAYRETGGDRGVVVGKV